MNAKFKFLLTSIVLAVSLSSCYTTKVSVGDVSPNQPMVKVNSVWNHHIIGGLVPLGNASMRADKYVGDRTRYVIETNQSFLNLLVNFCTLGLYTPTTTTYYLPIDRYDFDSPNENKSKPTNYERVREDDIYRSQPIVKPAREAITLILSEEEDAVVVVPRKTNTPPVKEVQPYRTAPTESKVNKPVVSTATTKTVNAQADGYKATIYFKDGARMDGIVTAESDDSKLQIKLPSGLVIESKVSEIEKIVKK